MLLVPPLLDLPPTTRAARVARVDRTSYDVLTDTALMRAHRLELPFGFDPQAIDSLPG